MIKKILVALLLLLPTALVVGARVGLEWVQQFDPNSPEVTGSRAWIEEIHQVRDAERRAEALEEIRAVLRDPEDVREAGAAMLAIVRTSSITYNRSGLRDLLEPYFRTDRDGLGAQALAALIAVGPEPDDLSHALAWCRLARQADPSAPLPVSASQLAALDDGHLRGAAAEFVIGELRGDDPYAIDRVVRGLWGVRASQELGAALVELLARCEAEGQERGWNDLAYNVLYYGLTTFAAKPPVVIDALLDELRDEHGMRSSRIVWALGYGVPPERESAVADVLVEHYDAGRVDDDVFALIGAYGEARHRAWLLEIAEHPRALTRVRALAERAVERYDARQEDQ